MRKLIGCAVLCVLFFANSRVTMAQTLATSTVTGIVSDPTGAVVPGAKVEFREMSTNTTRSQITNITGRYEFNSVSPGVYKITASAPNFRTAVYPSLEVTVGKSYEQDFTLQVGATVQTVEVRASPGAELQTLDAMVGESVGGQTLQLLPSLHRDVTALLLYQPTAAPGQFEGNVTGGQVAGARSDQNTFLLDGGDITSDTDGTGSYNNGGAGIPNGVVPTPQESIEEFRVGTNNPSATFSRSSGAQVILATKHGTNDFHGSGYWYHQNDNLNANTWDRNRFGEPKPELKDNRFGGSVGGPIIKNKSFFYFHFEGRRFPQASIFERTVPTDTLRQGILVFRDATGTPIAYDLKTSALCGSTSTNPCDPRGLGISPVIANLWNTYMPEPNDFSVGDGLNTAGFRAAITFPIKDSFSVVRLDHQINDKWRFMGSYRYFHEIAPSLDQIDFGGLLPGHKKGVPVAVSNNPLQPRYFVLGLTGTIKPNLTNDLRLNYTRHWWQWARVAPFAQVAGTDAALAVTGDSGLVPMNINTQQARSRIWNGHDYVYQDNATWVKGNHTFEFGGSLYHQWFFHQRDDKVVGALTSLIYQVGAGNGLRIPSADRPPTCSDTVTTNCLTSAFVGSWNDLYAATTGMVSRGRYLATRDGDFNPLPVGTPLREQVNVNTYNLFANDRWRVRRSLTISYGLTWIYETPPTEKQHKQTMMIDTATNQILDTRTYLRNRQQAALNGDVYNPTVGWMPVNKLGRKYPFDPDKNNFGPRIAAAWSPGSGKTVIRGGYSLTYDRLNGVALVMIPILGVGYGQVLTCRAPDAFDGTCHGSSRRNPTNSFRIGVDGNSIPIPANTTPPLPIVPGVSTPYELRSFQIDPKRQVGPSHEWDFSVQRELPGNAILEVGYVGRNSTGLYQGLDLNQVPFFMKDKASGQTFAQAFDATSAEIAANPNAAAYTAQPWFENALGGVAACGAPNCTTGVAQGFTSDFQFGGTWDLWSSLDSSFTFGPTVAATNQVETLYMISDLGFSNYNAAFVSLRKRASHGLTLETNFTWSHTNDTIGLNQQYLNSASNAFNVRYDYGPAPWDRRYIFNALGHYDLPVGRGHRVGGSGSGFVGGAVNKVIGGWSITPVYTQYSGLPLFFGEGCLTGGTPWGNGDFNNCPGVIPKVRDIVGFAGNGPVRSHVFGDPTSGIGINGDPANGGAGLNMFKDPSSVFNNFRNVLVSQDQRQGGSGYLRGQPRWNMDMTLAKTTQVSERVNVRITAEFLNIFNHVMFGDPFLLSDDAPDFGVIGGQYGNPRQIQLGVRIGF